MTGTPFFRASSFASLALLAASCGGKDEPGATVATSAPSGDFNSSFADSKAALAACTAALEGSLGYAKKERKLYLCEKGSWMELALAPGERGPAGATGRDGSAALFLSAQSGVGAGDDCRYGGTRVEAGLDADGDGALGASEVGSRLHVCEGGVNAFARSFFQEGVYGVGLVQAVFRCAATSQLFVGGTGTGWVAGTDTVITNAHVVPKTNTMMCNGSNQALPLHQLRVYFPKRSVPADVILRAGLPQSAGPLPDTTSSFDVVAVNAIDRVPETPGATARADLAFLRVTWGSVAPRSPLLLAAENPLASAATNVPRAGDEIFGIHYALGFGPRLSVATIFQSHTCESYQGANHASTYDPDVHCRAAHPTGLGVSPGALLTDFFGYGDGGASGSPVFDRFGRVVGVHTWGQADDQSPFNRMQGAYDVGAFLAAARVWNTNLSQ